MSRKHVETAAGVEAPARREFVAQGIRLEYFTVGWNLLETLVGLTAGILAGSVALVGFSVDSLIEVASGAALLWRLYQDTAANRERVERVSLRAVGASFLALAAYVTFDAARSLYRQEAPDESLAGIVLGVASLIVMPWLARRKRRIAAAIGSGALEADARQTDFCFYLSFILVGGLALNALFGWWWADPAAALLMAPLIASEGVQAVHGRSCGCAPVCTR